HQRGDSPCSAPACWCRLGIRIFGIHSRIAFAARGRVRPPSMTEKTRFMLALIAPAALVLVLFQVVPILTGANASFRDWTLHDPKRTWVGLANYVHVLRDPEFLGIVLPNTFGFMVASVACSLILGL